MPIKWKSSRFKPSVVLARIDKARTVNATGGASFSGFGWEECMPALHSMLDMPSAASEVDVSQIVWRSLTKVRGTLTPKDFLEAANAELNALLATKEEQYRVLTSISANPTHIPHSLSCSGSQIRFLKHDFPRTFISRKNLLKESHTGVEQEPQTYCKVIVSVKAKSPTAAINKGQDALDLVRSLWCLLSNPTMQISFGTPSLSPINVIRCGSHHTVHFRDGSAASEAIWFEPGFVSAKPHQFSKPAIIHKNTRHALRLLGSSQYQEQLASALVRYVRAFDEIDANTAFIRLWSAIESLTTPERADYDKLVQRCSFLFSEASYHRQILEHLREYRNESVHAGKFSEHARTNCYQLQLYFRVLIWFHLRNARFFASLEEANRFLDTTPDISFISRQIKLARKAIRFLA